MAEENYDILVEIPDEDLPNLAAMYKEHKNWAPHAYSTITTAIEWRKKSNEKYTVFLSPNNCWKEDGTFFVLLQYYYSEMFVFSLDETGKNIYEGLRKAKVVDELDMFICVVSNLHPAVKRAIEERKIKIAVDDKNYMMSIPKEEASNYVIECPPDVYIKRLDRIHAPILNSVWPHKYENSEKFIALLIELNEGYGVFLKSNDELVSWVTLSIMGQLGLLQTKQEFKRRGYGSLITKYMSKELAKKGHNSFGTVRVCNTASVKMFEKIGYRSIGFAYYIRLERSK